jgi:RNA polymerase sigma-70 factor (ECF subfamily)
MRSMPCTSDTTSVQDWSHGMLPAADACEAESALLSRLRAGDEDAFATLVGTYSRRLLTTARRLLRNDEDAADAVQEALLAAFKSIDGFQATARLSTWLHRIVINAGLMKLRASSRHPEEPIEDLLPRFDADGCWATDVHSWDATSDALLERRETRQMVRRCIDSLPETYRTVLVLRDLEDLDTEEVAEKLGITPNATKIRLHRARQALRTLLDRELRPPDHAASCLTLADRARPESSPRRPI